MKSGNGAVGLAAAENQDAGVHGSSTRVLTLARTPYALLALIIGACIAVYAPALNDWFRTDDYLLLRAATLYGLPLYVREAFDFRDFAPLEFYAYRPLYFISSKVLFNMFGLQPLPWHLLSLVLHCANTILVWHICRRLSGSATTAHLAAGIFALHPVYTTTVAWVSGFNSVTATTCQLACILAFLRFLDDGQRRWYALSLGAYTLGILYHQEIFLVCGVIYAYYLLTEVHHPREAMNRRAIAIFLPFAVVMGTWLVVQGWAAREAGFLSLFEPTTRNIKIMTGAMGVSLYPRDMGHQRAIHGVLASLFVGMIVVLAANSGPRWRVFAFASIWYVAGLVLIVLYLSRSQGTVLALIPRKIYPAGPALAIVLAMGADTAWRLLQPRLGGAARAACTGVVLVVLALAFWQARTYVVNGDALSQEAEAYTIALKREHPTIEPGATLHVSGVPASLLYFCPFLCYLDGLVIAEYGMDVNVQRVDYRQASDPAYVASLPAGDVVFCYRCP